jgi:hypothetical protein
MATWETVCEIMKALPGTELDPPQEDAPAWRVNGKVLARHNPRLRVPGEEAMRSRHGDLVAIRVFDRGERDALLRQEPQVFFITPHWQTSPSVLAWLADLPDDLLRELLTDAWRSRAPKRLVRQLDSG